VEAVARGLPDSEATAHGHTIGGGWFELRDVPQGGSYRLNAVTRHGTWRHRRILLGEGLSTGDGVHELVFERPHLVVRLTDADGDAWKGEAEAGRNLHGRLRPHPEIVVGPVRDEVLLDVEPELLPGGFVQGKPHGDGAWLFELEEDRRYLVGLRGGGQPWEPEEIHVPWGSTEEYRVERVVRDEARSGTLVLTALDATGQPIEDVAVQIEDPDTGIPLLRLDTSWPFTRIEWPLELELPLGTWRVVVDGAPRRGGHGDFLWARTTGSFEDSVDVVPGLEARVEARLDRGATLRVEAMGVSDEGDRAGVKPEDRRASPDRLAWWASRAALTLHRPGRWPVPVDVLTDLEYGVRLGRVGLLPSVALGSRSTSELLPPGCFTLRASLPGGRVVTAPVLLVEGETTDVRLEFR